MNKIMLKIKDLMNQLNTKIGYKKVRMLCSFVITFIFGLLGIIFGIFVGCLTSLIREVYNYFRFTVYQEGTGFNKEDLAYDVIGIGAAVILLIII